MTILILMPGSPCLLRYSGRMSAKPVTVVGAGIIGASIARQLAKSARKVSLIDARAPGRGATHAAAGMLAVGECDADSVWLRLGLRSSALYPEWVRELEVETGLKIDFSLCGAIEKADGDPTDLACRCQRQRALGIPCEMRGDGAYFPGDGAVDPRSLFQALLASCRRLGRRDRRKHAGEADRRYQWASRDRRRRMVGGHSGVFRWAAGQPAPHRAREGASHRVFARTWIAAAHSSMRPSLCRATRERFYRRRLDHRTRRLR